MFSGVSAPSFVSFLFYSNFLVFNQEAFSFIYLDFEHMVKYIYVLYIQVYTYAFGSAQCLREHMCGRHRSILGIFLIDFLWGLPPSLQTQ